MKIVHNSILRHYLFTLFIPVLIILITHNSALNANIDPNVSSISKKNIINLLKGLAYFQAYGTLIFGPRIFVGKTLLNSCPSFEDISILLDTQSNDIINCHFSDTAILYGSLGLGIFLGIVGFPLIKKSRQYFDLVLNEQN